MWDEPLSLLIDLTSNGCGACKKSSKFDTKDLCLAFKSRLGSKFSPKPTFVFLLYEFINENLPLFDDWSFLSFYEISGDSWAFLTSVTLWDLLLIEESSTLLLGVSILTEFLFCELNLFTSTFLLSMSI